MAATKTARRVVHKALASQLQAGDYYLRYTGTWYRIVEIDHAARTLATPVVGVDSRGGRIHDLLGGRGRTIECWITPEHRVGTTLAS